MNNENVDVILETEITNAQMELAKKFLGKFNFTTTALYALSLAVRAMYEEAEQESAPCADLLKELAMGALVQVEATEI